jgi:hypothetical protein
MYIYTNTLTHITNTNRQSSKNTYHARNLVCNYGEMIPTTTHETFNPLARPRRQVNVILYIYTHTHIFTHIYTHTHIVRPASPSTTHCPMSADTAKLLQYHSREFQSTFPPKAENPYFFIYIYRHTHIYTYTHTHTHTHRQTSKSIYHTRPLLCSYGQLIATTTHATFDPHKRPSRQVHVLYIL